MANLPTTLKTTYQGSNKTTKTRVRRTQFGDNYSQRSADGINTVTQEWNLEWVGSITDINELETFLSARGGVESFSWTPERESSSRKFTCPEWSRSYKSNELDVLTAVLIEESDLN